jgi:hypothetical protein
MTLSETARRRVGRVVAPLYAVPGTVLRALDRAQHRRLTPPLTPPAPDAPVQLLITIAHWRPTSEPVGHLAMAPASPSAERVRHLVDVLATALALDAERTTIAITTNEPQAVGADLVANASEMPAGTTIRSLAAAGDLPAVASDARGVLVCGWRPTGLTHRHPYYLTWSHKTLLRAGLADPDFSHFLYLEDDLRFTGESLQYWREHRGPLAAHGLLPGFVRVEWLDGSMYVVDQSGAADCRRLPGAPIQRDEGSGEPGLRFVSLPNAYQGMYVMDRPLALDHFRRSAARDPWRSRALVDWGIRERAAVGPILDDVPAGFGVSRSVVPVQVQAGGTCELDQRCTLLHLPGNYTRGAHPSFGIVRVGDMFAPATVAAG